MPPTDSTGDLPPMSEALPPVSEALGTKGMAADSSAPPPLPEMVGPYKVLGLLGAGGMGVVYLAEQQRPRRQVALKVMKPGTATREGLRRFEYEAQALGRLDHDGIARIYEAGTADAGHGPQPYFAMELIRGQPLTAYADAKRLHRPDRLRLLVKVCQAVQHAHQQGVIHRDLKPANVLVDEAGQPKVLDFGVARVTDSDVLLTSLHTDVGQLVGTLAYMSPEQAAADPRELDTRSDVYALGVLCYQLLTGRLPHDLEGKAFPAAVRAIGEEDPTPLSSIDKDFRGDLDTITAKALERDKARRYQTAAELAADVERYLRDEPIAARRPGTTYYLRKFAKRNKALVGGVLGVLLALVAGVAGTTWWALAAARAERKAQDYLADSRAAEQQARDYLADSYEQAARLAIQRGAWREAIPWIDRALATDRHRGSVPLRLDKVRALLAIDDFDRCVPEIEALAGTPNLGEHEGTVLLLQGDVLLGRDDVQAVRLIRRAQEKGLPPAEDAYARALLAETTPDAVALLRRSLALDTYQPRARTALELLLILLARFPEARVELAAHEALFPEDDNARVLRAQLVALEGDLPAANAVLDGLGGRLEGADLAALRALVKLYAEVRNPANPPDPILGVPDLTEHLIAAAPALGRLWPAGPGADPQALVAHQGFLRHVPLPPRLRTVALRLLRALADAGKGQTDDRTIDELTWAAAVHPEGTVLYGRALVFFGAGRFAEGEEAALQAADTPALFPVRQPALVIAASAEGVLYPARRDALLGASTVGLLAAPGHGPWLAAAGLAPGQAEQPGLLRPVVDHLRQALALGPIRVPVHRDLAVNLATAAHDFNLARQILDDWERQAPDDPGVPKWRALTELRAGAYGPALAAAEKGLRRQPGNELLLGIKKEAALKLVGQARPFLGEAPPKRAP